jgi:Helix-turn-helix domain
MDYEFEPLVDADEVARLLGLHPKTVQLMARGGKIPALRVANSGASENPKSTAGFGLR